MKAVRIHAFGGPEVLRIEDLPDPEPSEGEILVRVLASSVNPVDYKIRNGDHAKPEQLPIAMGRDIAGVVERLGTDASGFAVGDRIYAMLPQEVGGQAELVALPASACAIWPGRLDPISAASVPLAALTAWQGLFKQGGLEAGQQVLIHGAGGGVGHLAVQFARARCATVTVTASAEDRDFLIALGAARVIDYKSERFEDLVSGVDLVLDLVAGETQDRSWAVLKKGGMLVSTLTPPSEEKAAQHGARGTNFMAHPDGGQLAKIADLIEAGEVTPTVERVFPLDAIVQAQTTLEKEHIRGKIVVQVAREL